MYTPRDYQIHARDSVPAYFAKKSGNPLIAMPTGTGKSLVIAELIKYIFQYPGQRVVVATHVQELIEQNHEALLEQWPSAPAGIISAGLGKKDYHYPITFVGIASVARKAELLGRVDIFIIDEAHLLSPSEETTYQKVIKLLKTINPMMKVVGLTATKWRLGHGEIAGGEGNLFTDLCIDMTTMEGFNWFISQGYLCTLIPKNPATLLDVSGVHMKGGEFKETELQLAVDKSEITERALREAMEYGANRKSWLIFAAGVDHAIHIAEMLTALGIDCKAVHSGTSKEERRQTLKDFKSGALRAVVNNNVLTTGFNHPGVDFIIMLRPTASTVLWVQMLGRGTRPVYAPGFDLTTPEGRIAAIGASDKHDCLVMDFAGNTKRLGAINDPVVPRRKGEGSGEGPPIKLCMSCGVWNHASLRHCCACGAEFIFAVKMKETADTAALIKADLPVVEVFEVDLITYTRHEKRDGTGTPSMKLNYYCGLRRFHEFVPIEAQGSARGIARRWWNTRKAQRSTLPEMPDNVDDAIALAGVLPTSTHIRVWTNKQYPEILAHCFDGTKFGTQPASGKKVEVNAPVIKDNAPWKSTQFIADNKPDKARPVTVRKPPMNYDDMDDDIPF